MRGREATATVSLGASDERERMLADVLSGLRGAPKTLPSKYFYDEAGSRLFDEITELDEYYLTRIESGIMQERVRDIVRAIGSGVLLVELGSGSSAKTRLLLDHLPDLVGYVPIDISREYLNEVAVRLREEHPGLRVSPVAADFTGTVRLPPNPQPPRRTVVYFPGSTIGNFNALESVRLLRRMRTLAGPGGAILIGFDLVKPRHLLHAAYNDARGVTARFNLNLLARINRELGGDFDLDAFEHHAPFDEGASRIEMHLVSRIRQVVRVDGHTFDFERGESILTEYSHKYTLDSFADLARLAGLAACGSWSDPDEHFCVQLLTAVESPRPSKEDAP